MATWSVDVIGVLIITHGSLAEALKSTVQGVVGPADQFGALCLSPVESPEGLCAQVEANCDALDTGDGVLILVDVLGGTPCNIALRLSLTREYEVLTGVNLPMLLSALTQRCHLTLDGLSEQVCKASQDGIVSVLQHVRGRLGT